MDRIRHLALILVALVMMLPSLALADSDASVQGMQFTKEADSSVTVKVVLHYEEDPLSDDIESTIDLTLIRGGQEYSLDSVDLDLDFNYAGGTSCPECANQCSQSTCKVKQEQKVISGTCATNGSCDTGGGHKCICEIPETVSFQGLTFQIGDQVRATVSLLNGLVDYDLTNNELTSQVPQL